MTALCCLAIVVAYLIGHHFGARRHRECKRALRDLLLSADASWYEQDGGHDWRQAVNEATRLLEAKDSP